MKPNFSLFSSLAVALVVTSLPVDQAGADWNQWRGPNRNGISEDKTPISVEWPEELAPVWKSEPIPSDHDGGHSSCVVAGGKVYMTVVWHKDVPTETRTFGGPRALSKLGYRGGDLSDKQKAALEKATYERDLRLRGSALEEWSKKWVDDNLSEEQKLRLGSWCISRIRTGKSAVPLKVLDALNAKKKHIFQNEKEMEDWLAEQGWDEAVLEKIRDAVPSTEQEAEDVVICLDAETGKTLWKFAVKGTPTGRKSSSTTCVVDGKVYALGGTRAFCLNADSGEEIWRADVNAKGAPSSFLVEDGVAVILAGKLIGLNANDGTLLWEQDAVTGDTGSPVVWEKGGKKLVVCHDKKNTVAAVDLKTGEIAWEAEGGGQSTPVVSDNHLVVFSGAKGVGFCGYVRNEQGGVDNAWSHEWLSRRYCATPIIHDGYAYLFGGSRHMCVRLKDGEIAWEEKNNASITSPILVDGKFLILDTRGSKLLAIRATPEEYELVGSTKVGAMQCPTPAISGGKLFVRAKDGIVCFDLR